MFDNSKYTIGWVCALRTELVAATEFLDEEHISDDYEQEENDNNTYVFGNIGKHNIVIATLPKGEYGTTSAATVARDMIRSFKNVRIGLMVGIAGGAPLMEPSESRKQDIRLGDVVVSVPSNGKDGVIQYDFGKTIQGQEFKITGRLNSPPHSLLSLVNVLGGEFERKGNNLDEDVADVVKRNKRMKNYRRPDQSTDVLYESSFIHCDDSRNCAACCKEENVVKRQDRDEDDDCVVVHDGLIASANQLMKNALLRDKLARDSGVLCFEMEAAGLMNQSPFLAIRGICDYSDSHKNKEWQGYAAMTAAAYARKLLLRLAPAKVEGEKRLAELEDGVRDLARRLSTVQVRLDESAARALKADVEQWLAAPDPEINLQTALRLREPGTGTWLMDSTAYQQWRRGDIRHLWLHGKAGCGKSVISGTIVEDVRKHCAAKSNYCCAMFFFSFSDASKQSHSNCCRSIIQQLAGNDKIAFMVKQAQQKSGDRSSCTDEALKQLLEDSLRLYDRSFIVLDALDESPDVSSSEVRPRDQLMNWVQSLSETIPGLQIIATSRPLSDIESRMTSLGFESRAMAIECVNRDIKAYTAGQLARDSRLRGLSESIKGKIQDAFMEKADGMFRWAYCQMKVLKNLKSTRPTDIDNALKDLPPDLDETYSRMLSSIPRELHDQAMNLLKWLVYARRPLTLVELSETRIIDFQRVGKFVDLEDRGACGDVLGMLEGLVIETNVDDRMEDETDARQIELITDTFSDVDDSYQAIRLAHFSVQEYLESSRIVRTRTKQFYVNASKDEEYLAHCCIAYLIDYAGSQLMTQTIADLDTFPLLAYAAKYWYKHSRYSKDVNLEVQFLESSEVVSRCSSVHYPGLLSHFNPFHEALMNHDLQPIHGLHWASTAGLDAVVHALLHAGCSVNVKGGNGGDVYALHAASRSGHDSTVKMLIEAGADVNANGGDFESALQVASEFSRDSVIKMLIEAGADVNAQGGYYGSALYAAITRRHESTVQTLLEAGADIDAQSPGTAISLAIHCRARNVLNLLMAGSANLNSRNLSGRMVIHEAARSGDLAILKNIHKTGKCNTNAKDELDRTVLDYACMSGSEDMLEYILKTMDIVSKAPHNSNTWSPLHWAGRNGTLKCMRMLQDAGMTSTVVKTSEPDLPWTLMDLAVYHCNRLLVSEDGTVEHEPDMESMKDLGFVDGYYKSWDAKAVDEIMLRANDVLPAEESLRDGCDGCWTEIRGIGFSCLTCRSASYCLMCKHAAEGLHTGHIWSVKRAGEVYSSDEDYTEEDDATSDLQALTARRSRLAQTEK